MLALHSIVAFLIQEVGYNEDQVQNFLKRAQPHCNRDGYFPEDKLDELVGCTEIALQCKEQYTKYGPPHIAMNI